MILFKKKKDLQAWLTGQKQKGLSVGFVPTMGALHEGHIYLINSAKKGNDIAIASIFVNPAQFNDPKDFEKYPVNIEKDIYLLEQEGCDVLFLPSIDEIYPPYENKDDYYDLGYLETVLEGKFRPGHFQGVCKVMNRLLKIVLPDDLYMGQKDYQQCMVIKKLIELSHFTTQLHICPTLREKEGLAMSSRNLRLTHEQKEKALAIHQSLLFIKKELNNKPIDELKLTAQQKLQGAGFAKIDYVEIANAENLSLINEWDGKTPLVALIAAFMGEIRLIDNMIISGN